MASDNRSAGLTEALSAQITMPYTLTPGLAAGTFLAELANRRIIGSKHGDRILVPAQDFDGASGAPADGFVEVAPVGTLTAFSKTAKGVFGFVLLDGTDVPLTHQVIGLDGARLTVGARVEAVWAETPGGTFLDLAGFGPAGSAESFDPRPVSGELAEPIEQVDHVMTLDYEHSYGHYYGTLFAGIKDDRRVRGAKCSHCRRVLLPPRAVCDVCHRPVTEWVDVAATGTIQASSVVHVEFIGQRVKPPYVYVEIVLDGTSTRLIHMVAGVDPEEAKTLAAPGARVQAVWSDRHTGSLADIEHFELIGQAG